MITARLRCIGPEFNKASALIPVALPPPAAGRTHSVKVLSNHAYDILLQTDNRTDKPTRQD